jgi:hypothetical protein
MLDRNNDFTNEGSFLNWINVTLGLCLEKNIECVHHNIFVSPNIFAAQSQIKFRAFDVNNVDIAVVLINCS